MVTLRPGSHVWRLLTVLSAVGEFPAQSLHLLGSERSLESWCTGWSRPMKSARWRAMYLAHISCLR